MTARSASPTVDGGGGCGFDGFDSPSAAVKSGTGRNKRRGRHVNV